jgi:hypothetical protein
VTKAIEVYGSISAGSITSNKSTTPAGTAPSVTVQNSSTASGGSGSYTYVWLRSGMALANSSSISYALNSDAANYYTAGTYIFTRYAKDATCNTAFVASSGQYTLGVLSAPPPLAYSTTTWSYGVLTWSDRLVGPTDCDHDSFTHDHSTAYCRSYTENSVKHYYYNWPYVKNNASTLCPSPWRVPTSTDFDKLEATAGSTLVSVWGYGGYASSSMTNTTTDGYYWSSTEDNRNNAYYLNYGGGDLYDLVNKGYGFQVRCVK